jgi:hypothetical protein
VAEHVVQLDLDVEWEPNAPEAVLVSGDFGRSYLAVAPHFNDADERMVVIAWEVTRAAAMHPPNDEAVSGHPLYSRGLADVRWAGEVLESKSIDQLERQNRVHHHHDPERFRVLRHFILPLKESTVEVVARDVTVLRIAASSPFDSLHGVSWP